MEKHSTSEPSPLSPTRWTPDAFAWPRSLAALAIGLFAFGASLVLASYVAARSGVTQTQVRDEQLSWGILIAQLLSYVVIVPVILVLLPWLARRSLRDLGLRPLDGNALKTAVYGALAMYAVTIAAAGLQYVFTRQKVSEAATSLFTSSHDPALTIAFGVLAVVVAPFVEEFEFRGFLFNAILRYAPMWVAATLSGIVFGLSHGSLTAFFPLAASGMVLAYVYYRTGSLVASMVTHGLFNGINVALLAIGVAT